MKLKTYDPHTLSIRPAHIREMQTLVQVMEQSLQQKNAKLYKDLSQNQWEEFINRRANDLRYALHYTKNSQVLTAVIGNSNDTDIEGKIGGWLSYNTYGCNDDNQITITGFYTSMNDLPIGSALLWYMCQIQKPYSVDLIPLDDAVTAYQCMGFELCGMQNFHKFMKLEGEKLYMWKSAPFGCAPRF